MESIVLTIHLILALLLIGVVLLQKNEGAALLSGGGNTQARGQATAMTKLTWIFAAAFIATSIGLTVLATRGGSGSVIDGLSLPTASESGTVAPGADLLPPSLPASGAANDAPAAPPRADEPAAETAPAEAAPATPAPAQSSN